MKYDEFNYIFAFKLIFFYKIYLITTYEFFVVVYMKIIFGMEHEKH